MISSASRLILIYSALTILLLSLVGCGAEVPLRGLPVATLLPVELAVIGDRAGHADAPRPTGWGGSPSEEAGDGSPHPNADGGAVEAPPRRPAAKQLVISEIMADPLLLDDAVGEYVEVIYLGPEPVSVAGVQLVLPDGRSVPLLGMPPKVSKRGRRGTGSVANVPPVAVTNARLKGMKVGVMMRPGEVRVVRSTRKMRLRLPNRAGRLELRRGGVLLDVVQWTARWPWPKHRAGRALCRVSGTADGRRGRSWRRCRADLRGLERGSPGVVSAGCAWLRARKVVPPKCADAVGASRRELRRKLLRKLRRVGAVM